VVRVTRGRYFVGLVIAVGLLCPSAGAAAHHERSAGRVASEAVVARSVARLGLFSKWLANGHARGLIGEVGWPGNPAAAGDLRWNHVAEAWYRAARAKGLWVSAWATGELWASSYKLAVFRAGAPATPVGVANPQAGVIEAQGSVPLRGINVEQGSFGEFGAGFNPLARTSPLSNRNVGAYGSAYSYPSEATYAYLAGKRIAYVRLAFRWERIQPTLGGPLDPVELERLRSSVEMAGRAGVGVILDCHNYGVYFAASGTGGSRLNLGSGRLPIADLVDLWRRLSVAFRDERAVIGYGLMNEPVGVTNARAWEAASSAVAAAIRGNDDRKRLFVAAFGWDGVGDFSRSHPAGPWIDDPISNTWYEAHQYFDSDMSSRYQLSFDQEAIAASRAGY
jgi:Cellulase (glycosyl hydrolase family 5)